MLNPKYPRVWWFESHFSKLGLPLAAPAEASSRFLGRQRGCPFERRCAAALAPHGCHHTAALCIHLIWSECDWHSCAFDFLNLCAHVCDYILHIHLHLHMIKYYMYTTCSYKHTYIYNYMQVDGSQTCIVSINVPYAWIYSCTCNYICTRKFNIQHDNIFTQYHYNPQGHIHTPKKRIWCITCLWSARGNNFMTCDQLYKSCRCVCP